MANQDNLTIGGIGADPTGAYTQIETGWNPTYADGAVKWLPSSATVTTAVADTGDVQQTSLKGSATTGFTVMATANTKGKGSEDGRFIGTNILNEAFLERFPITVEQEYPSVTVEKKIINKLMTSLNCLDEEFSAKLVDWADLIRKTFYDGGVDEIIATRRLVHIVHAFSIFKDRMKAIAMCVARFDDQTKETFMDLYSKLDDKVSMPSDETEEGEFSETTETVEEEENFKPF